MIKISLFIAILFALLWGINDFLWDRNTFYDIPENTVETVFIGSSRTRYSIIPMELYKEYGLCTYNLGTDQQPELAAYYWLQEAYRLHGQTLKTVVLDSMPLSYAPKAAFYQLPIDSMKPSRIKYEAVKDYVALKGLETPFLYFVPLLEYHEKLWKLTKADFEKDKQLYTCGYEFRLDKAIEELPLENIQMLPVEEEPDAPVTELAGEALPYFLKILDFCRQKNLNLVLTTAGGRSAAMHNAVLALAQKYQLPYIDFNCDPVFSEVGLNAAADMIDSAHTNYYGARKISLWMGNYLIQNYGAADVRGNERYSYMDRLLAEYEANIGRDVARKNWKRVDDYLQGVAAEPNCTILVAVKDEGSSGLDDAARQNLAAMGLTKLAQLGFRAPYLAVIENGRPVYEASGKASTEEKEGAEAPGPISWEGQLPSGAECVLTSGGMDTGNTASCKIKNIEYAQNTRGLNVIVYDNRTQSVLDSTVFDTCASSERIPDDIGTYLLEKEQQGLLPDLAELPDPVQMLCLYDQRVKQAHRAKALQASIGEDGLWDFLMAYWDDADVLIFLAAQDDAAGALLADAREAMQDKGLLELSELEFRDSYIGLVRGGKVLLEQRGQGTAPVQEDMGIFQLASGGLDSGIISSVMIDGKEYSPRGRGLNIVVYDTVLKKVVDSACFDTCAVPVRVA